MKTLSKSIFNIYTLTTLLVSLLSSAVFTTPVYADTLTVTDCSAPVGAGGRLVNVIASAQNGDVINFSCSGTIVLANTLSISKNLRIDGSGQSVTISGDNSRRVIYIANSYSLTLQNLTIADGYCDNCFGSGIYNNGNLTVNNSMILNNSAHTGGGIYNDDDGILSITSSTIAGNSSTSSGGGIFSNTGFTVVNSTFSNNSAGTNGGGLYITSTSPTSIANSTFSGNSATNGGGIFNNGAELYIVNSTIAGNTNGRGLYLSDGSGNGPMEVQNSIIANNAGGSDCFTSGLVTFTANAFNLDSDGSCNNATQKTIGEINLGPLADNGGSTLTHALLPGSFAINTGDNITCETTDQRGIPRPFDGTCDIGAFEFFDAGPTVLVNSILPTSRTPMVGSPVTVFNTVVNAGSETAYGVTLAMNPAPAGTFTYTQTNCATNAVIGAANAPVDIPAGEVTCYVLSFTPSAPFSATQVHIQAQAANASATSLLTGINTWLLRTTDSQGPDIIALTTTTDFHQVPCSGVNAFAVALSNVGTAATGDITVSANTGAVSLPLSISIQETNPGTGVVIGDNVLNSLGAGENRTVAVFVAFNGCVNFDPALNRIFIEFRDASNNVVGSTSTAVSTNR